jgi:hypothetical protein
MPTLASQRCSFEAKAAARDLLSAAARGQCALAREVTLFDDLGISSAAFAALAQHGRRSSGARAEHVSRCATMMTRGTAGASLFAALDAVGVREGRVQLPAIWGALTSWWVEPVADVAPSDDRRFFYLSQAPAGVDSFHDTVFAGQPPSAIAALNLICLEFSRDFVRRSSPRHLTGLGGAGITLWYQSAPIWDSLRATPEWIDLGISTPSYDWSADPTM